MSEANGTIAGFRRVDPLNGSEWQQALGEHQEATIFHASNWAKVLCETYSYTPFYFVDSTRTPAQCLCLIEVDSWLTGKRGVSLPFTDEVGVLGMSEGSVAAVFNIAKELGKERQWKSVEFRGVPAGFGWRVSVGYAGHTLDLGGGLQKVEQRYESSVRRAVRKAEKSGVNVAIEKDAASIKDYFELHCLTRRKHGVPPQPFRFFANIYRYIISSGLGFVALARIDGKAIAGAIFFGFSGRAVYKFGASNPAYDSLRPSNLVMARAIQRLVSTGFNLLDFGRTSLCNEGLRRYKLGWGSCERQINYVKWDLSKEEFVEETDRSARSLNKVFQYCPLAASRLLGNYIYRHVA